MPGSYRVESGHAVSRVRRGRNDTGVLLADGPAGNLDQENGQKM